MNLNIDTVQRWYPSGDPVHGLDHVWRVYHLAERLGREAGADLEIVRAAALLHDAQDETAQRADHQHTSAALARHVLQAQGWEEERICAVEHCIRAHRFRDGREPPATLEAQIVFDADKLDAIGATGVARAVAYAAVHAAPFFAEPSERFLKQAELEPGEPHSAYHEYLFKLRKLKSRLYTAGGRLLAEERHNYMSAFFERLQAESDGRL